MNYCVGIVFAGLEMKSYVFRDEMLSVGRYPMCVK